MKIRSLITFFCFFLFNLTTAEAETAPTPTATPTPTSLYDDKHYQVRKPAIYLYPKSKSEVSIKISENVNPIFIYPPFNFGDKSWKVIADTSGNLTDLKGDKYRYLFWEGDFVKTPDFDFTDSDLVESSSSLVDYFKQKLKSFGLNQQEINDFIVYWYPILAKNKLNQIHFATTEYSLVSPLSIFPEPDVTIQVYMAYKNCDKTQCKKEASKSNQITNSISLPLAREGKFVVVEWGGGEVN